MKIKKAIVAREDLSSSKNGLDIPACAEKVPSDAKGRKPKATHGKSTGRRTTTRRTGRNTTLGRR